MAYYLRKENKKKGTYLQMYESHWDKEKKQPRSKSVMAFGYVNFSDMKTGSSTFSVDNK